MNRPNALLAAGLLATGCLSPQLNSLLGGGVQLANAGFTVAASQPRSQPQPTQTALTPVAQPAQASMTPVAQPIPAAVPIAQPIGQSPTPFPGTVVIRVVNTSTVNICQVYMAPRGEPIEAGAWLAQGDMVPPGATREFNVRSDKFNVRLMSCTGQAMIDEPEVDLFGPRELAVYAGSAPAAQATPGFRRLTLRASVSVGQ